MVALHLRRTVGPQSIAAPKCPGSDIAAIGGRIWTSGPKYFWLALSRVECGLSDGVLTTPGRQRPRTAEIWQQRRPPFSRRKRRPRQSVQTAARHRSTSQLSSKSLTRPPVHSPVAHCHSHTAFIHSLRLSTQLVCKGFAFVCTPKNVRGLAWRLCVVAFAARLLGSAARLVGSLESALRQLGGSSAARWAATWWRLRAASAACRVGGVGGFAVALAAPQLASAGCVDECGRRGVRGLSGVLARSRLPRRRWRVRGVRTSETSTRPWLPRRRWRVRGVRITAAASARPRRLVVFPTPSPTTRPFGSKHFHLKSGVFWGFVVCRKNRLAPCGAIAPCAFRRAHWLGPCGPWRVYGPPVSSQTYRNNL